MAAAVEAPPARGRSSCFVEVGRREIGSSFPRASSRRISGSEDIVMRMIRYGKLKGHAGCVNTVSFNPSGDLLVSGSDDTNIILWDWLAKTKKLVYPSGHQENVFHARVMPFTDDSSIVTVAADGQHIVIKHNICNLLQFDLRSESATKLFTCYSFSNSRRRVRLNTIAIDLRNPCYFSIGGSDEYVRLYDMRFLSDDSRNTYQPVDTFCPKHLMGGKVHITGIAYSYAREILVSYNDEHVYLFQSNMGLGPNPVLAQPEFLEELEQPQSYSGHRNFRTVKGVSFFGPSDEYVVSGSDCGNVFIWRKKGGELMRMMHGDKDVVNCIEPNPHFPFLATSGIDKTVKIWTPTATKVMPLPKNAKEIIASNEHGREVDASRAQVTLSSDVIMHVLRLHRRRSESHREQEPSAENFTSDDDDDAFYIGFGNGEGSQGANSDPRECIVS
ncbi:hypothetical protein PR202_gb19477 [Eleusine coracana subsp. coracana]|uniref:Uncharacterized protein n=1 Tax=Eleusine coracana subsp. coracana TaxID=191504 RepID=A0AAV5F647_ELECO|nr:hypothetical protein PR202_gb19477 [Eleusine coracana subsp. coracana]